MPIGGVGTFMLLILITIQVYTTYVLTADWTDCPANCHCKWISGKKNAICREAGYTSIPNDLNSEVQVLDLTGNAISTVPKEAFKNSGLVNLQKVFIKHAGVQQIDKEAFKELTILVEVDLSNNFIGALYRGTFSGNERLRVLTMNDNPLTELQASQFPRLPHLKSLEFQNCRIKFVHANAFDNTPALESLNLIGNKLNHLSRTAFVSVPNLKTLILDGNAWDCDCQLRNFRNWLLQSKLYSRSLTCEYPPLFRKKRWEDIDPVEFACEPRISLTDMVVQGEQGGNVTLRCNVSGDPEPEVTWSFNGIIVRVNATTTNNEYNNITEHFAINEDMYTESDIIKSSSLSIFDINETDAGDYTCQGHNLRGLSASSVSLVIPKDPVATTMKRTESWFVYTAFVSGSLIVVLCALLLSFICQVRKRSNNNSNDKKRRRKGKLKTTSNNSSITLSDQDKKLLDASITTSDRQTGSCEGFGSQQDMELMEQSVQSIPMELREPPVHITIESHGGGHPADPSIAVFPPPPEFSTSILPHGAFGNIFISVSVGQDPVMNQEPARYHRVEEKRRYFDEMRRYPDLLDVSRKVNAGVGTTSEPVSYFATLPRKCGGNRTHDGPVLLHNMINPHYDNMGPRITANGSSIISLPDTISIEDIPTPPPPPLCSPLNIDYVSL